MASSLNFEWASIEPIIIINERERTIYIYTKFVNVQRVRVGRIACNFGYYQQRDLIIIVHVKRRETYKTVKAKRQTI